MQKSSTYNSRVSGLYISQKGVSRRENRDQIQVDALGVVGDKFYDKEVNRSVLLSSTDSYSMAREQLIEIEYGSLGENILLDYDLHTIPLDTKFSIGEAEFLITQKCTLCKSLTKVDSRLPNLLKDDRGIFAKVIKGGVVKMGDSIEIHQ